MDDVFFEELDHQDIERIEEEDNDAPVGPDEAEEEKVTSARDVKPKKISSKPRLKLDDKRLKGPRGLCVLEPVFKNIKLKGHGHEKRDLDTVMSVLEHWAHRLFPKMTFDDCLEKIEELGHKKSVTSYLTMTRFGCGEDVVEVNDEVVDRRSPSPEQPTVDPFDSLLDQPVQTQLTQEQKERMERNQLIAIERRRAKLKAKFEKTNSIPSVDTENINADVIDTERENEGTLSANIDSALNLDEESSSAMNNTNIAHEIIEQNTIDEDFPDASSGEKVARESDSAEINDLPLIDNIDSNNYMNLNKNVIRTHVEESCTTNDKISQESSEDTDISNVPHELPTNDANEAMDIDFINFNESVIMKNGEDVVKSGNDVNNQGTSPETDPFL